MQIRTKDLVYMALMVVLLVVCSWSSIVIGSIVPFTLQTFAVFCTMLLLGGWRGSFAIAVYILMGAVGLPVFSGFRGGFGALLGPTGGYILGFLLTGVLYWALEKAANGRFWVQLVLLVLGLALCYGFGTVWFIQVYGRTNPISVAGALGMCVLPYLPVDAIKLALAAVLCRRLKPVLKLQ